MSNEKMKNLSRENTKQRETIRAFEQVVSDLKAEIVKLKEAAKKKKAAPKKATKAPDKK